MALSHIAHLVDALSSALNIPLLHPIVMVSATECMISPHYNLTACYSLSPVTHLNTRAKHELFHWLTPAEVKKSNSSSAKNDLTSQSSDTSNYFVNSSFPLALTLLQADIIALCLRAGLSPDSVWPPQAMLLNLHELLVLCAKCVKRNSAPPSQSILQTTARAKGTVVEVSTPNDPSLGNRDSKLTPAVPHIFHSESSDDPVVRSLTKRCSCSSSSAAVGSGGAGYGSVSLPSDLPTDDEDGLVIVEEFEEQEEEVEDQTNDKAQNVAVRTQSKAAVVTSLPTAARKDSEYDEGGYGLTVVEEEYDMLDLLLESQVLAERGEGAAVDTTNENELWP